MSALGQKRTYAPQKIHVRFAPNSDRESGLPQTVMSALPTRDVRFGPKADIERGTLNRQAAPLILDTNGAATKALKTLLGSASFHFFLKLLF